MDNEKESYTKLQHLINNALKFQPKGNAPPIKIAAQEETLFILRFQTNKPDETKTKKDPTD